MRTTQLKLYPVLGAAYPVLLLAAQNGDAVAPSELLLPLAISLCVTGLAWVLSRFVTESANKRALMAFLVGAAFAGYVYLVRIVYAIGVPPAYASPRAILGATAVAILLLWVLIARSRLSFADLSRCLNIFTLLLLTFAGAQFLHARATKGRGLTTDESMVDGAAASRLGRRPDVYVIVLDAYSGSRSLRREYDFDNSDFEEFLRQRDFVVPRASAANYAHTFLALSAMLNGDYVEHEVHGVGPSSKSRTILYPLIENNLTARILKKQGYRFIFLPTQYVATAQNRNANLIVRPPGGMESEFEVSWVRLSPLLPIAELVCGTLECWLSRIERVPESADAFDWRFRRLGEPFTDGDPAFVFAHFLLPHEPFIYNADCSHRRAYWPSAFQPAEEPEVKAAYIAQLSCVNRKVRALVDRLLDRTAGQAIIIIQADHGYGRLGRGPDSYRNADSARVAERLDVFSAYHLPQAPEGLIYDSITPVNAFRAVLRHYFGADLPQVEDRSYWSEHERPFALTRMR